MVATSHDPRPAPTKNTVRMTGQWLSVGRDVTRRTPMRYAAASTATTTAVAGSNVQAVKTCTAVRGATADTIRALFTGTSAGCAWLRRVRVVHIHPCHPRIA